MFLMGFLIFDVGLLGIYILFGGATVVFFHGVFRLVTVWFKTEKKD